jgi:arylsulfatase A-like enzyme
LDILGLMPEGQPQPTDGISLLPLIQGKMVQRSVPIPFETLGGTDTNASRGSPKMALVDNRYKLLTDLEENSEPLLFDLVNDPGESTNLAKEFPERVATMKMALEQFRDSCMGSLAGKDYAEEFTPDNQDVHPSATRAPIKKNKRSTVLP